MNYHWNAQSTAEAGKCKGQLKTVSFSLEISPSEVNIGTRNGQILLQIS
jgi:hypothetical protein